MKNVILAYVIIILTGCGAKVYKSEEFKESKQAVKIVAILPVSVSLDAKYLKKDVTPELLKNAEEKISYEVQNNMFSWFLKRHRKYTVTFQDIEKTNLTLANAGITYSNMALKTKEEICKVLNVDGIITGKCLLSKPLSEGQEVASMFILGGSRSTNKGTITLNLYDSRGDLQWKFEQQVGKSKRSGAEGVIDDLMSKGTRAFPYQK